MPEMFGLAGRETLSPQDRSALERIREELSLSAAASCDPLTRPWVTLGTIQLHSNDPTGRRALSGATQRCAWIGEPFPAGDAAAPDHVVPSLIRGDGRPLIALHRPFLLAVADEDRRALYLASDPFGLHPVYYSCRNERLIFCTRLLPLLRQDLLPWRMDGRAVLDLFTYEHVTGDRTFADTVRVLPPGTILEFHAGRATCTAYARPLARWEPHRLSAEEAARRMHEALHQSLRHDARSGRRIGIPLSGGLDSRALLGCALQQGLAPRTYTFGQRQCRDVVYAAELARLCGLPHNVVEVDGSFLPPWLDHGVRVTGGMISCIHYHILALARMVSSECDVALDGLGADAWTGGHLRWTMLAASSAARAARAVYRIRATGGAEVGSHLLIPDLARAYDPRDAVGAHFEGRSGRRPWIGCHRFDLLERQRRFIQYGPHLLRPLVDVRTPFYSPDMTALLGNMPGRHLAAQRAYVLMHRRHLSLLAGIPDSSCGLPLSWPPAARLAVRVHDALRRRIARRIGPAGARTDRMTTDYRHWFRTGLREFVRQTLLDSRECANGLLRREAVARMLDEHFQGRADHTIPIGCALTLQAFCRLLPRCHPWPIEMRPGAADRRATGDHAASSARPGATVAPWQAAR